MHKSFIYKLLPIFSLAVSFLFADSQGKWDTLEAKDYGYLIQKTRFDKSLMQIHLKLYQGYVNNTNALFSMLKGVGTSDQDLILNGALKRRLSWEYDGVRLHELFFDNIGSNGKLDNKSLLYKALVSQFGNFDAWKQDFIKTGKTRGIGWVILMNDPQNGRLTNMWIDEHNIGLLSSGIPILVMDVWEHAYLTQFGLDRDKYINAFLAEADFTLAANRFCSLNGICPAKGQSQGDQND